MRLLSRTTHYYVHVLLHSERIVKESNDRALLKNLGVWLGLLTLARNKPILSKELELKTVSVWVNGNVLSVGGCTGLARNKPMLWKEKLELKTAST